VGANFHGSRDLPDVVAERHDDDLETAAERRVPVLVASERCPEDRMVGREVGEDHGGERGQQRNSGDEVRRTAAPEEAGRRESTAPGSHDPRLLVPDG
jgi:hypothetical protein